MPRAVVPKREAVERILKQRAPRAYEHLRELCLYRPVDRYGWEHIPALAQVFAFHAVQAEARFLRRAEDLTKEAAIGTACARVGVTKSAFDSWTDRWRDYSHKRPAA